jgi:lipoprotein NlpD
MRFRNPVLCAVVLSFVAGCVSNRPAPVVERTVPGRAGSSIAPPPMPSGGARPAPVRADARPDSYTVKAGDTLYSIALEHGLDYRELAIWNRLDNPGAIKVGMQLRLSAPAGAPALAGAPAPAPAGGVVAAPLKGADGTVEGRPLGTGPAPVTGAPIAAPSATPAPSPGASSGAVLTEPKALRMPYSEQALAQLSKPEAAPAAPAAPKVESARPEPKSDSGSDARAPEDIDWAWPVKGKIVGTFNDATSKGIAIAGKLGTPVLASAPGRVIFSGTGIRGFGKLVVIKHNNTYLSVYAHNSELNVKEGQSVAKGQKIAEMGNTDADQVKLHFEIRRFGKPVDPLKLLPAV